MAQLSATGDPVQQRTRTSTRTLHSPWARAPQDDDHTSADALHRLGAANYDRMEVVSVAA